MTGRTGNVDAKDDEVSNVLKGVPVSSIEIMEVYTGPSMIPPAVLDDACAVILDLDETVLVTPGLAWTPPRWWTPIKAPRPVNGGGEWPLFV
jgi:hypothetical protein